ncbi:hypothetical protein ADK67_10380 [Saccharothrix sp. NRRL B-16348]|nr:hypothetical protein ADK67_10380 [Saccharothrix sp. NRRL B-16348]
MVEAQYPLAGSQARLEQWDRTPQITRRMIGASEVVTGGQRVRVVEAQHPLAVNQTRLIQRDRTPQITRRHVGTSEVVTRIQRVRVVGA